jgi:hypothetical protein
VGDEQKAKVSGRLGLTRRYYAVSLKGFTLVILDTNDISGYAYPSRAKETAAAKAMLERLTATHATNAQTWNGAIGARQVAWFEKACLRAGRTGKKVVVFAHHPISPPNAHNAWNAPDILGVLQRQPSIVAWINGHNHHGAYDLFEGVPCVTLNGMVETPDKNAFALVNLLEDRLEVLGHGREPSREVAYRRAV